jgi:hypothetical protein
VEKTKRVLSQYGARLRRVIADSQYSDRKIRRAADETVIPYPANQRHGVENLIRVDKKFRTYGPEELKKEYHKRTSIETVALFSLLCLVLNGSVNS